MIERSDPDVDFTGLKPVVAAGLSLMADEYTAITGRALRVNSAFRSWAKQKALHAASPATAALPGRSMHNYGYAVDVDSAQADTLDRAGLLKKYGFWRPLKSEPWHLERVGIRYAAVRAAGTMGALLVAGAILWFLYK